jgi:hypothetical protein
MTFKKNNIYFENHDNIFSEFYTKYFILNWYICCLKQIHILCNIICFLKVWSLLKDREMLCLEGAKKYVHLYI